MTEAAGMEHRRGCQPRFYADAPAGAFDRRQSARIQLEQAGSYQFNVTKGKTFELYEGPAQIRDMSSGGMCLRLDREPEEHGIVEVYTTQLGSTGWVWLLGICWVRKPSEGEHKWLVGGRFLFGRCLN